MLARLETASGWNGVAVGVAVGLGLGVAVAVAVAVAINFDGFPGVFFCIAPKKTP